MIEPRMTTTTGLGLRPTSPRVGPRTDVRDGGRDIDKPDADVFRQDLTSVKDTMLAMQLETQKLREQRHQIRQDLLAQLPRVEAGVADTQGGGPIKDEMSRGASKPFDLDEIHVERTLLDITIENQKNAAKRQSIFTEFEENFGLIAGDIPGDVSKDRPKYDDTSSTMPSASLTDRESGAGFGSWRPATHADLKANPYANFDPNLNAGYEPKKKKIELRPDDPEAKKLSLGEYTALFGSDVSSKYIS